MAFTAFLGWDRGRSHRLPRREGALLARGRVMGLADRLRHGWARWSCGFWVDWLAWKSHWNLRGIPGEQVPVLNSLRCGGRPEFGHEDADNVEEEDEVDL